MAKKTIDLKGLTCPLPILRANRVVKDMKPGDTLEIHATDPNAPSDFQVFTKTTGNELLKNVEEDGVFIIVLRKSK